MKFELTILGCGGAIPTLERKPTSQYLNIQDRHFLIDCGEGTQIQLRKFKCKFSKIDHIFISHLHGDHFLGIFGYLSSLNLLGRNNDIHIYAPENLNNLLEVHNSVSGKNFNFNIVFHPLNFSKLERIYNDKIMEVYSFPVKHSVPTCGFLFKEKSTDRRMIKEKIKELDLNIESIKKFKNSENCEVNGVLIDYNDVTSQGNQPRTYAYCADSQYDENIISYLENVDLIYHESTFLESKMDKAIKTKHSTAKQAATIALKAKAKQLIIGHFSARYDNSDQFLEEAKVVFNQTITAYDGYTHQIKIEN
ncbi:MAG: ribonuclease Z [Crocinitomicaceae bacterium]|nr:ribonuclease Z [Crocinitomicaceae bacterium]